MRLKVLVVDDHAMFREGLVSLFSMDPEIELIEEADNGQVAILKAGMQDYNVIIMDYEMPNFNGIYASREIISLYPKIAILMVSMHQSKEHIIDAIQVGVMGYLSKESRSSDVLLAVKALGAGKTWFKGEVSEIISSYMVESAKKGHKHRNNSVLTNREMELVRVLAEGYNVNVIAEKLNISTRTVEAHKANIFQKLKLKNSTELIRWAIKNKVVSFS